MTSVSLSVLSLSEQNRLIKYYVDEKGGGNAEGQCYDDKVYTNPINLFFKGGRDFRKKGINNLVA